MNSTRVIGIDPSNIGAAWAVLDCGGESGVRNYVDKGEGTLEDVCMRIGMEKPEHVDVVVGIERPPAQLNVHVYPNRVAALGPIKARDEALWAARAKAGSLIDTAYMAGSIGQFAKSIMCRVVELRPDTWRTALNTSSRKKGTDQDDLVREAIATLVRGWPARSNVDTRDACGVALAAYWHVRSERRGA